jgi:hypothetical protein
MFPDQQNQNGGQPGYQPPAPQQALNGQYAVMPPLPAGQNNGHSGHNPYEFIVNPNTPKHGGNALGGDNFLKKIGLLVGGLVVVLIIAAVVISHFAPKGSTPGLTAIAQRQQEIVRIATLAVTNTTGQDTKNLATNIELSVTSNQTQIVSYLASHGTKLKAKDLALDKSSQTDTLLTNATSAGTYDSVVAQTLASQLQTYESLLQTTYKQTTSKPAKQLIQSCYDSATKLLKQAKSLPANSNS